MPPQPAPRSNSNALEYRMSRLGRLWLGACGIGCIGVGLWFLSMAMLPQTPLWGIGVKLGIAAFALFLAWGGSYCVLGVLRWKTLLWDDRIAHVGVITTRNLHRSEVRGYRLLQGREGLVLQLFPADDAQKPMNVAIGRLDPHLQTWIAGLPDLDARDHRQGEWELYARPDLGSTPEARRKTLERYARFASAANVVGWLIPIWAWLFPWPRDLALAVSALVPLAGGAAVAASRGVLTLGEKTRSEPRPGLIGVMFAGLGIVIRAMLDLHLVDWVPSLMLGAALGVLLTGLARRADPKALEKPAVAALFCFAASAYGWGLIAEADTRFDTGAPQVYRTRVLDKYSSVGERHTSWNLQLGPWGPSKTDEAQDVGRAVYDRLNKGDEACVRLYRGALKIRWFIVDRCAA